MRTARQIHHQPILVALALLLAAALALGLAIDQPTGLTGKDEYLLGMRVPLEMMQGDHWWVPFVDGEPRLKKPPFIYWLGRASFETFGPSFVAARGITVAFACVLLACVLWLGRRLGDAATGCLAAGVLLGISGMATESRRLMLDVPVAALSTAGFCFYLHWLDRARLRLPSLVASALCLSAALLTKGPIALVAFGSGWLALIFDSRELRDAALRRWPAHLLLALLAVALPLAWYLSVHHQYGTQLAAAAHDELEARQFPVFSLDAAIGLTTLALPWTFVALQSLWRRRRAPQMRFLGLWLLLSLLPFFLIRTFERYLIASLVPLALMAAFALRDANVPAWTRRLGSLVPLIMATLLALLLWRFRCGGWAWLLPVIGWFAWVWWQPATKPAQLIVSAILLWSVAWGLAFPSLGVNAVPEQVVELARGRQVTLFAGPQPALLPMLLARPLRQTSQLKSDDVRPGALLGVRAEDDARLQEQLKALGAGVRELTRYQALTSAGSGIRFAREGAHLNDWQAAWDSRSTAPLCSTVIIYEVAG